MRITYENTMEDLIAFTEYHYGNSAAYQKQIRITTTYLPVVITLLVFGFYALIGETLILVFGLAGVVIYSLVIRRILKTQIAQFARKQYGEQDTSGVFCEHTLEFDDETISEFTDISERHDKWTGVQDIVTSEDYLIMYVGLMQGHVIPRKRVVNGNFDEFVEAVGGAWEKVKRAKE